MEPEKDQSKKVEYGTLEVTTVGGQYLNYKGVPKVSDVSELIFFETDRGTAGLEPSQIRNWEWSRD